MSDHMSWLSEEQTMSVMIQRADKGHVELSNPQEPCGCTSHVCSQGHFQELDLVFGLSQGLHFSSFPWHQQSTA